MNSDPAPSTAGPLNRWRSRFFPSRKRSEHLRLGTRGEKMAGRFLRQRGYKILHRNFRGRRGGEIDLICRDDETLVFVEVKTRSGEEFGRPIDAVHRAKRQRIMAGGLAWLRLLDNPDILFRFDVVEVVIPPGGSPRFELIENAFRLPDSYLY